MTIIFRADDSTKNMKRESRVYSYKEQLEEIQLRKELEEKRKASGKPTVYSAKQKEAIKLQLTKEAVMREKVSKVFHFLHVPKFKRMQIQFTLRTILHCR